MNLNFYNPNTVGSLESLQSNLEEQINKLQNLRNLPTNVNVQKAQAPLPEQRYYLDCGNKEDWVEFLRLNYNLTEKQIFDDYKLFLQAKAELAEDSNKEKLEAMKQKISPRLSVEPVKQGEEKSVEVQPQQLYQESPQINVPNNANNSVQHPEQTDFNRLSKNTVHNANKGAKYAR